MVRFPALHGRGIPVHLIYDLEADLRVVVRAVSVGAEHGVGALGSHALAGEEVLDVPLW
jgi:hypothetical protein